MVSSSAASRRWRSDSGVWQVRIGARLIGHPRLDTPRDPTPVVRPRAPIADRRRTDVRLRRSSVNQVFVGWQMRQNSQVGIHDSRFTHSLLVHVNTCGRVVRDGIQHHRDFWWTFEDTPHALFYASCPASEDTNRERHAVTLAVVRWPWQVSGTGMPVPTETPHRLSTRARAGAGCVARPSWQRSGLQRCRKSISGSQRRALDFAAAG
jgi:hypothetical protein